MHRGRDDRLPPPPRARLAENTIVREESPRVWLAQQRMLDPTGAADWVIECVVDLTVERPADAPLISLRRVGT